MPFTPDDQPKSSFVPDDESGFGIAPGAFTGKNYTQQDIGQVKQNLKDYGHTAVNSLPAVGGAAGAFVGGLPGAFFGAETGSAAKNLLSGDKSDLDTSLGNIAKEGVTQGVLPDLGGKALSLPISGLGKLLKPVADRMQRMAMGVTKSYPGAGTTAIEEGVRGTTAQMASKMDDALTREGSSLDTMISKLHGESDAEQVANKVADYGKKYISPEGYSTEAGFDRAQDAVDRGTSIYNRGNMPFTDTNKVAQTAYSTEGFSPANTPRQNYNSTLARIEAGTQREQIKQAGEAQGMPEIRTQFDKLSNLLKGNQKLNPRLPGNIGSESFRKSVVQPTALSYGAKGVDMLGNAANATSSGINKAAPNTLRYLLTPNSSQEGQ